MIQILDRIKRAVSPPVTAEWIDMVVTDRSAEADRIEELKGSEAADRHREKTGRLVRKMQRRGVI